MKWNEVAKVVENDFGTQVDWEERFFVCPECGEPLYTEDWPEYNWDTCPICGFEFFSE